MANKQTDKPALIFTDYGLAEDDMKGNFLFETDPHFHDGKF